MTTEKRGVVLVGHGGIPRDCPQELITRLKRLEAQRRTANQPPSAEEIELDMTIRRWPRTASTDPYQSGLEAVAAQLKPKLDGILFGLTFPLETRPAEELGLLARGGGSDGTETVCGGRDHRTSAHD